MNLLKSLSWITIANLVMSLTKWIILILIARITTPTEVGIYSLAFALTAPIALGANMKLRSLYLTEEKLSFGDYVYTRNTVSIASLILMILISVFFYNEYIIMILLVGISKILDLQSDLYYSIPHKKNNLKLVGKLIIIKHLMTLSVFAITLFYTENVQISLILYLLIQIGYLNLNEKRVVTKSIKEKSASRIGAMKSLLIIALPMGFVQIVVSLNTFIPRYFIEWLESPEALGVFSAISYVIVVGNIFMGGLAQVLIPRLSKWYKSNMVGTFLKVIYVYLLIFSFIFGSLMFVIFYYFGDIILLLYGEEYSNYQFLLIIMSIVLTFNVINWVFDIGLLSIRYLNIQYKIAIFIMFFNLMVSYFLINYYGMTGAAWSMVIVSILQAILRGYFLMVRLRGAN
ncbi:oligosaccharide flippase family protein [Evansella clarkii]|uniref:oligosaccharide flippase family protein n=1 Tax=Evansella clarkii TaxID=79879 RepID=UPI000B445BE2|nr:oligosaccharide flippase family protein [Evansella clarkii]